MQGDWGSELGSPVCGNGTGLQLGNTVGTPP